MPFKPILGCLDWKIFLVAQPFYAYFSKENSRIIFEKLNRTLITGIVTGTHIFDESGLIMTFWTNLLITMICNLLITMISTWIKLSGRSGSIKCKDILSWNISRYDCNNCPNQHKKSHNLFDENGHTLLSLEESWWNLKQHDQYFPVWWKPL